MNDLKRKARTTQISVDDCPEIISEEDDLEKTYIREEQKIIVHRALRKLKPEYRQILWLIYFEDFSNKEAAAVMKNLSIMLKPLYIVLASR